MKTFKKLLLILSFITIALIKNTIAAEAVDYLNEPHDSLSANDTIPSELKQDIDTVIFKPILDTTGALNVTDSINYEHHLSQNPTLALFKSLAVPGLGQIGNHRYIKAGFFIGLETWFASKAIDNGSKASDLRKLRDMETELFTRIKLNNEYEHFRDQRNKYIWFTGITIFVSMFDAFVDAHLSGQPEEQKDKKYDLSFNQFNDGIKADLSYNF